MLQRVTRRLELIVNSSFLKGICEKGPRVALCIIIFHIFGRQVNHAPTLLLLYSRKSKRICALD